MLREGSKRIQTLGVRPELEIFDTGNLWFANVLVSEGLIDPPPLYQLCMGIPYGAPADPQLLQAMVNMLPEGAEFTSFSIGRNQLPWVAQSVLAGGHARVGLEDNLYLAKGVKATNEDPTKRAVSIIEDLGAEVATPDEAREILNLTVQSPQPEGTRRSLPHRSPIRSTTTSVLWPASVPARLGVAGPPTSWPAATA